MDLVILVAVLSLLSGVLLVLFKRRAAEMFGAVGSKVFPAPEWQEFYKDTKRASRSLGMLGWVLIWQGLAIGAGLIVVILYFGEH